MRGFASFFAHVCSQDLQTAAQGSEYGHTVHFAKQDPFLILVPCINLKNHMRALAGLNFSPLPPRHVYILFLLNVVHVNIQHVE